MLCVVFDSRGSMFVCVEPQIGWRPYPKAAGVVTKHIIHVVYTEFSDSVPQDFEVGPDKLKFTLDEYHELPIDPDEEFKCVMRWVLSYELTHVTLWRWSCAQV